MTDKAIVAGEYVTFKHIKTRKMVVLEIEVPEEMFQDVISRLGMPIGGESKPVAVALLDKTCRIPTKDVEQTEGEKLRVRAVMLCKEYSFYTYIGTIPQYFHSINIHTTPKAEWYEDRCADVIYDYCKISSRSELAINVDAQNKFREINHKYVAWLYENQYSDNLNRI